jgi:hypothetical protein
MNHSIRDDIIFKTGYDFSTQSTQRKLKKNLQDIRMVMMNNFDCINENYFYILQL